MRFILAVLVLVQSIAHAQLEGAWKTETAEGIITVIYAGKYFSASHYDLSGKKFIATWGGSWEESGNTLTETQEFNTANPVLVGTRVTRQCKVSRKKLTLDHEGKAHEYSRIDDGTPGALSGAWLITGRMNDGKATKMTPGVRRTMKILSGTRFQWIAYNVETKEFFGTGGGTYTTIDGQYTETLEFFSRDNSRVGNSLKFQFNMEEGRWRHSGLSSKGEPIDEYWSKRESIGI